MNRILKISLLFIAVLAISLSLIINRSTVIEDEANGNQSGISITNEKLGRNNTGLHLDNALIQKRMSVKGARPESDNDRSFLWKDHFQNSEIINERIQDLPNGNLKRTVLFKTDMKYKNVILEEEISQTEEGFKSIINQKAMVADHIIVSLDKNTPVEELYELNHLFKGAVSKKIGKSNVYIVKFDEFTIDTVQEKIPLYLSGNVKIAEPDYLVHTSNTPNDPSFNNLYGLHNTGQTGGSNDADIDAPEAWDITIGSQDILVGVIDTGIDHNHPDLAANMWINPNEIPGNGIDDDNNGYIDDVRGWDFVNNDNDPMDDHYHGTHCAGTIGAVGNNGVGITGVCWNVSMVGLKFLSSGGSGTTSDAIEAVLYGTSIGVDMTSNSWGGGGFSQALKDAIDDAGANDILFIAAAGNSSINNDSSPHYPSSYESDNVIAVAATDHNDQRAYFTNYGLTSVDIGAPGVDIYSCSPNGGYQNLSGTSMATPHVAGAAALLKSINPGLSYSQIKTQLMESADPIPALDGYCVSGARLNVFKSILFASGPYLVTTEKTLSDVELGNGDGIFNPGESITFDFSALNVGGEGALGVSAVLSSSTPGVSVSPANIYVGDISSGVASDPVQNFIIEVADTVNTPLSVDLSLVYTDSQGETWTTPISFNVYSSVEVSGQISTLTGNIPVEGAIISYNGPISGQVTSDASGSYNFSAINGTYSVSVSASGFNNADPVQITIPPGIDDLDFQLSRAAIQVTPNSISTNLDPGQTATETITISNDGDAPLEFSISTLSSIDNNGLTSASNFKYSSEHFRSFAKGALDSRSGNPVTAGSGGPDTFGYQWVDSNEPGGPQFVWNDISTTGTLLSNISNSDDAYEAVNLTFNFPYYGIDYSTVYVSSNGYLTVGSGSSTFTNYPLPSTSAPSGQIAGFADDLYPVSGGNIYFKEENNRLIVQYDSVVHINGSGTYTYQIVLDQNGTVIYYYNSMVGSLDSATVGIQNTTRNDGLTVAYNTAYIEDGLAVRISAGPIWLSLPVQAGIVNPGESVEIDVNLDSTGLNAGVHNAIIQVSHNIPGTEPVDVPLTLEVNSVKILSVSPETHNFGSLFVGGNSTHNFDFTNTGNAEITVSSLDFSGNSYSSSVNLPFTIPPFSSVSVPIQFTPASIGSLSSDLSIGHDADNTVGTVALTGIGLEAPVASLIPQELNFELEAGSTVTQTTILSNSGGNNLEYSITNISFGSQPTSSFNIRKGAGRPEGNLFAHRHVPNQLIVGMKNGVSTIQGNNVLGQSNLTLLRQIGKAKKPGLGVRAFGKTILLAETAAGTDLARVRDELLKNPNVEYVEPNYIVQAIRTPDDSSYSQLYGMHNTGQTGGTPDADIDAPEAWDIHTGNANNVLIGVIDTGINYNHPDLAANIWTNPGEIPGNGIDDDGNGYIDDIHGWDFANNDNDPMDDNGHGSHCSGTIAGAGNNGQGVVGVMWEARLVGLKFLGSGGSGSIADAVDALLYANAMDIHITSNSWGGGGFSQAMQDALDAAALENRLFIAAAGNSSSNNDSSPHYPSSYENENVIAVAATDHNDNLAYFSSYGATSVDIAAPGVNTYSTVLGTGYDSYSGTSMATPHVAGVAGLLWSYAPSVGGSDIKNAIMNSADQLANLEGIVLTGGRLNAFEALQAITPPWFSINPTAGLVAGGSSQDLTVTVDAVGQVAGTYSATVDISTNDPLNPVLQLSVNAVITGEKRLVPDLTELNFPLTKIGQNSVIQLTLTNSGADHTEITDISLPQGFSYNEVFPLTVNAYQSITIPVTFTPTAASTYSGNLQIINNSIDGDLFLPISGEGRVGAAIEVNPLEFTLSMNNGEQRTETVNITNIGDLPLDYSIVVNALTATTNSFVYGPEHHAPVKKGAVDTRSGQPVVKGSGGPDSFGYSWSDSNEPGGPQYVWNDISTTGTRLSTISGSDDSYEAVNINFNFPFYGTNYSTVYVSSNGYLTVGSGSSQYSNYPLPSTSSPAGQIAGFADDLYPVGGGDIYYKEEANKLIVQFDNVRHISSSLGYTFQIVIDQHGAITYYYNSMDALLTSSTIGIQNTLRNDGLTVAYNTSYVTNGLAVRISTAPAWLTVNPESGTVNVGENQNISLDFDTTSLGRGIHQSSLSIINNSVSTPTVNIPVTLTISNTAPTVSDINANTVQDSAANIILAGSDIDNDSLTYEILTNPSNGLVSLNGGTVTYTPNPGFNGSDSFTYKANDGLIDSGTATVFVTVDPLEPRISSSTSSVYFSSAYIGQSRTYNVTFTNNGNSPTTISEIYISNPVFTHTETIPIVLNAGTSRTVVLTFTPDTAIEHLGTLTVVSDAIDNPNLSISLRGYGNLPYLNQIRFDTVIPDGQYIGVPFSVTVSAINNLGNLMTDFNGTGTLSADGATVVPSTGLQFINGVWTGQVTLTAPVDSTRLVLSAGSRTGYSNTFDVKNAPVTSPDTYVTKEGVPLVISSSPGGEVVNLMRSISFTGSVSEMDFSEQFGYLCIRESVNSVKIINPFTNTEITSITPENGFHDMDLTPDGRYLFVTDHQPNYGYESDVDLVHRYDLLNNSWTTYNTLRETRLIEAVSGSRFLSVQGDQHTNMSLNQITGESLIELDIIASDYYGNPEYDHSTGKVFIGNSGSSSREIHLRQVDGDNLLNLGDTGTYGSASSGGGSSVLASDASVFYYGDLQVDANNITKNLNEFPEIILAAGSSVAFGSNSFYFAKDGTQLGQLGFTGSGHYVTSSGKTLWVFDSSTNQIHQYSVSSANFGSVLANDSDIDGDLLTASLNQTVAPVTGTLAFNSDGTFTYTPAAGFTGSATFTYIASDSELTSSVETVTINVEAESKELVAGISDLDFGDVILGNTVQRVISLTNTGNTTVSISDVSVDNARFSILGDIPLTVGPGESDYITVSFSATDVTEQLGILIVESDSSGGDIGVNLSAHGRVGPMITVSPSSISEILDPGESATRNVSVTNDGDLPLEIIVNVGQTSAAAKKGYGMDHHAPIPKGEIDTRKGNPVVKDSGGPDNYGYSWIDSDDPSGPAFVWDDISVSGTRLPVVSNGDDVYEQVGIGFPFKYYGVDYNSLYVSSNGYITLSTAANYTSNYPLPSSSAPATIIAGFHDDLDTRTTGDIYFKEENGKAVIQFEGVNRYGGSGNYTFQIILFRNGNIMMNFKSMTGSYTSGTTGIQNHTRDDGLTVSYNSSTWYHDDLAVLFSTAPDWIQPQVFEAVVDPGQTLDIPVNLVTTFDMEPGIYESSLTISHNAAGTVPQTVDVDLTVNEKKVLTANPMVLNFREQYEGTDTKLYLELNNEGNSEVTVTGLSINNSVFTIEESLPIVLPVYGKHQIAVTFTPDDIGQFNGQLSITSDSEDSVAPIQLIGEGGYGVIEFPWYTQGNTADHRSFVAGEMSVRDPIELWQYQFPMNGTANNSVQPAVIGNGKVYANTVTYFDDNYLIALDLESGTETWQYNFVSDARGFSAPAYFDGSVYVQRSNHNDDSRLMAISTATGSLEWSTAFSNQWYTYFSPTPVNDKVFINGGYHGGIYGYNRLSGQQLFFTDLEQYDRWSPAFYNNKVYSWVAGFFREMNPETGITERQYQTSWNWSGWSMNTNPALENNKAFMITNGPSGKQILALDLNTFSELWQSEVVGSNSGSPSLGHGLVYVSDGPNLKAFSQVTGALDAVFAAPAMLKHSQPIITNDCVITSSENETYIFDKDTAQLIATLPTGGFLSLSGRKLITADSQGQLTAYQLRGTQDVEIDIAGGNGTVIPSNANPAYGEELTLNINAAPGYIIKSLTVNRVNLAITGVSSYAHIIDFVKKDVEVSVEFELLDPKLKVSLIENVTDQWQTVSLDGSYYSPVIVTTPVTNVGNEPVVTRIRNAGPDSFEIKVQRADGLSDPTGSYNITYMVVEEGVFNEADHGIKLEAFLHDSSTTSYKGSWTPDQVATNHIFDGPIVFGQIMTDNDDEWSAFFSRGATNSDTPDTNNIFIGKHVGEDTNVTRNNEDIGCIIVESGTWIIGDLSYRFALSQNNIDGFDNSGQEIFPIRSDLSLASQCTMSGNDGGWAVLLNSHSSSNGAITVAIDEDKILDDERSHSDETVSYVTVRNTDGGNLTAGLKYWYYENNSTAWSLLPEFSNLVPSLIGVTDVVDDKVAQRTEHFGIVFEGFIEVPESGDWTFSTRSDDGSKLYINDYPVVDNDGLHGAVERSATVSLPAGLHKVKVEFFERTGGDLVELYWQGPTLAKEQVPASAFFYDSSLRIPDYPEQRFNGLGYSYFENDGAYWSVLPDFTALTPKTVGTTDVVDDKVAERGEDFGLVFDGYIQIPQDGEWTFYTRSDDGSKFYIDSEEIVNNDGLHGSRERSGVKGLHAGLHRISVEFFERGGGDFVELYWEGPGQTKQQVPASAFFVEEILDPVKDDFYAVNLDTDLSVTVANGVLANDALTNINVELLTSASSGSISLNADGSFVYSPNNGFEGVDQFTYRVVGGSADQTGTVTLAVKSGAGVLRDVYLGITGMNLTQLRQNAVFESPDFSDFMTDFEGPTNWNDSYATRLRSRVVIPVSGTYNFYIAGDDSSELLFSTDSSGAGAARISWINGWTSSRQWNKYSTQKSSAISLTAGQIIYLEALSIEGGGGDNLAAGWSIDGGAVSVITNEFILFPEGSGSSGAGESTLSDGQTVSSIGNTAFGSLAAYDSGTYLISASGADIWGTADAFGFVHQDISGDMELIAKVNSLTNTNSWAKAGVMIRETLNPDSKHAMSIITPGNGASLQRRATTGGASSSTSFGGVSAPQWVKILRVGNRFTGYFSSEGSVWFPITSVNISMAADVKAGLALTSHNNSLEAEAVITDFSVKTPDQSMAVTRFVLVNADTGEDIRELSHNSTINLTTDGANLSVRAETSGTNESVVFQINGTTHFTANESVYAISGTTGEDYNSWTPVGSMTLMATPYSADNGSGNVGSSLAIVVNVTE